MISVVICSYNRGPLVERAAKSVLDQETDQEFEVIVVDNASTDDTVVRLEKFKEDSRFQFITERKQGASHARNAGCRLASGDIFAFIDDDAYAAPGWIEALWQVYRINPDVGICGGHVVPDWEKPPPSWLHRGFWGYFSVVDLGSESRFVEPHELLVSANMAVPRHLFEAVGSFDVNLGRRFKCLLSGEEAELRRKVEEGGARSWYESSMRVYHRVEASRCTHAWLRRRYYWQGVSHAIAEGSRHQCSYVGAFALAFRWKIGLLFQARFARSGKPLVDLLLELDRFGHFIVSSGLDPYKWTV